MHVAHEFWESAGSPIDRAVAALTARGVAVANGGISTGISVMLLSFSGTAIMTTYFKMLGGVVIVGLWHALVLLPVALVALGAAEAPTPTTGARDLVCKVTNGKLIANGQQRNGTTTLDDSRAPSYSTTGIEGHPPAPQLLATPTPPSQVSLSRLPSHASESISPRQATLTPRSSALGIHPAMARTRSSLANRTPPSSSRRSSGGDCASPISRPLGSIAHFSGVSGSSAAEISPRMSMRRVSTASCSTDDGAVQMKVANVREQMDRMAAQLEAAQVKLVEQTRPPSSTEVDTPAVVEGREDGELGV